MIYLHPSLGISNAPSTPPRITDPSYIDRIYEFVGVQKAQFGIVIEASNGTVLDDIKETRLTAHLFDAEGRELTEHLTALSLYWEEHNETWTEVGRGWSYLVNDTSRFLRLFRVRVSQLDIMTALGATIDVETKKTLARIMVQQEVKITSSSSIYSRIPSADLIHQQLVNDAKFRELVKGDAGKDAAPIRPNLLEGFMGQVVNLDARNSGKSSDNYNYRMLVDGKWLEDGKAYVASADFELVDGKNTGSVSLLFYKKTPPHALSHTNLNGKTKGRVSIYIPAGVHNANGIAGYAGYAGETRGVAARYSNIKLEEVQDGETKESTTYLPHLNDLKGAPGKSLTLADLNIGWNGTKLTIGGETSESLKGEKGERGLQGIQGIQGIQGLQGKPGVAGKDGKSLTLADLNIGWNGTKLTIGGETSESLKGEKGERGLQGIQGIQGIQGLQGKPGVAGKDGKDATPVRPNLWSSNVKIYPNMGHGADNVHVTYKGDGVYRVTKHDKMYVVVSMYSDKLQDEKTTKAIITSWRVAGASRQELLDEKYLKNKNGRYYITKNTEHKEVNARGTLYAHPWRGDENHWIDGDWIEFADVKVELVEDGDILEPTAYIPNIPSLDYLAASTAQKITQESIYLSRIQNGMARYDDFNQVRKIVEGHQVNWETLDDNYLRPIRQLQEDLKNKQNDADRRLGNVEQDIIRFAYRAVNTNSSGWTDYTHTEYVGGGYKPDPWGGGGVDGYIRTVHDYEIYRAMDGIPSTYIEQSKKVLRDKEYKIGDKYHRDGSATIVYDIQSLSGIERGQARHWRLFTTPYASTVLRYGNRTTMGNQDMQGQQIGSYYNVHLNKGTTYDIYAYNDGSSKYKLYIIKNGSYK